METNDILALRPQADASNEIRASLQRIRGAIASIETTVAASLELRNGLLLSGSATDIHAAEIALAEARGNQEQLVALSTSVAAQLPITERAEKVAYLRASVDDANKATRAMCDRFRKEYPPLAAALANLLSHEAEVLSVRLQCNQAWLRQADLARDAEVAMPIAPDLLPFGCPSGSYHESIGHLPGVAPPGDTTTHNAYLRHWPLPQLVEPQRPRPERDPRLLLPSTNPGYEIRKPTLSRPIAPPVTARTTMGTTDERRRECGFFRRRRDGVQYRLNTGRVSCSPSFGVSGLSERASGLGA
jgi:hypothetical protein